MAPAKSSHQRQSAARGAEPEDSDGDAQPHGICRGGRGDRRRCASAPGPAKKKSATTDAAGRATRDGGRIHVTPRHPSGSIPFVSTRGRALGACPSRALKPLADATSAAVAALRAPRALAAASSPVAAILAASKAASKSYKAARTLGPAARLPKLPSNKRLKAAFAAASLLRLATAAPAIPAASPSGVVVLAVLKSGYKLSKNTSKIVEGFLGLQVHKGLRNGIDALGVVVKVAVIASEVALWVGGQFWGYGRGRCVRFLGFTRPGDKRTTLNVESSKPDSSVGDSDLADETLPISASVEIVKPMQNRPAGGAFSYRFHWVGEEGRQARPNPRPRPSVIACTVARRGCSTAQVARARPSKTKCLAAERKLRDKAAAAGRGRAIRGALRVSPLWWCTARPAIPSSAWPARARRVPAYAACFDRGGERTVYGWERVGSRAPRLISDHRPTHYQYKLSNHSRRPDFSAHYYGYTDAHAAFGEAAKEKDAGRCEGV
ncbi:uncharacterized protein C2845_PM01G02500 [Panicum miliaceum]|uniref:Uncharacterized protein n=1 Tax=Panicum miliaceum TaxID=4540 RepID=A0A3L6TS44_PANMI|nr:uncharacterized protein C2845_PM01G02500 [Panicum miliaceum]